MKLEKNESYSALKGIAMCLVMFGHIGIIYAGGYAVLFFVIMSGVLCRVSYKGGVQPRGLCKIHMV